MSGADLADLGRVHIVGIGGAGMSGIASILAARGVHVTGSDAKESRRVQSLRALGIEVSVGHQKSITADTLVYSTAILSRIPSVGSHESIRSPRCLAPQPWRRL